MIPEFAILGHPNEGKSSVLSTLAEDDSVRVSPTPGETTRCRTFPVVIDGREILRFVDTPGFQNPRRILKELRDYPDNSQDLFRLFIDKHLSTQEFADDCELLQPVVEGAGIIYVVDASRPLRNVDRAEMEILRLTGKPRMAVMNCKENDTQYLVEWKNELRKSFNSNRLFNAHRATYAERILLLESLKSIDQDWQQILATVVDTFKKDWELRNARTADILCEMLTKCLSFKVSETTRQNKTEKESRKTLTAAYTRTIQDLEKKSHQQIRGLFKHNIFNYNLPSCSILHEDLFNSKTWELLGLDKKKATLVGGIGGATLAAGLDLAAGGASLGLFTALGGTLGAVGALYGGKNLSTKGRFLGIGLGAQKIQVGPNGNIQFLFVLLDRALLYYSHIINWAHGRRDYPSNLRSEDTLLTTEIKGYTQNWPLASLKVCHNYFKIITTSNESKKEEVEKQLKDIIRSTLLEISQNE